MHLSFFPSLPPAINFITYEDRFNMYRIEQVRVMEFHLLFSVLLLSALCAFWRTLGWSSMFALFDLVPNQPDGLRACPSLLHYRSWARRLSPSRLSLTRASIAPKRDASGVASLPVTVHLSSVQSDLRILSFFPSRFESHAYLSLLVLFAFPAAPISEL